MKTRFPMFILAVFVMSLMIPLSVMAAGPKGAKAIFDSGEGPSVSMSLDQIQRPVGAEGQGQQRYVGINYQLLLVSDDGQFQTVSQSRVFRPGERLRLLVRTNRPGYMTIYNVGPTGNTNLLFNEPVEAFSFLQIPKNTNMRFTGPAGTEKIFIMLSDQPNPMFNQPQTTATGPQTTQGSDPGFSPQPPPTGTGATGFPPSTGPSPNLPPLPPPQGSGTAGFPPPPPPTGSDTAGLPPPPMGSDPASLPQPPSVASIMAGVEGSKSLRGAKDIVVEDSMKTNYAVISRRNNYRPVNRGMKDIVLESSAGNNYGVVPAAALTGGGILTVEIKLEHR